MNIHEHPSLRCTKEAFLALHSEVSDRGNGCRDSIIPMAPSFTVSHCSQRFNLSFKQLSLSRCHATTALQWQEHSANLNNPKWVRMNLNNCKLLSNLKWIAKSVGLTASHDSCLCVCRACEPLRTPNQNALQHRSFLVTAPWPQRSSSIWTPRDSCLTWALLGCLIRHWLWAPGERFGCANYGASAFGKLGVVVQWVQWVPSIHESMHGVSLDFIRMRLLDFHLISWWLQVPKSSDNLAINFKLLQTQPALIENCQLRKHWPVSVLCAC